MTIWFEVVWALDGWEGDAAMSGQVEEGSLDPWAADRARITGAVVESARAERVRREELELARREAILESLRPPRSTARRLMFNDLLPREIVLP